MFVIDQSSFGDEEFSGRTVRAACPAYHGLLNAGF
jgi:hypothetical protein